MHLADAFIQSDLQLHSGYTFSLVCVFPGNTHTGCWVLGVSHMDVCKNTFEYHLSDKTHGFGWQFIHSGGASSAVNTNIFVQMYSYYCVKCIKNTYVKCFLITSIFLLWKQSSHRG